MINITVDDKTIKAEPGRRLIDVLIENGWDIPHFCYHPGLGPDGNCRMCQVEMITPRGSMLVISCNTNVAEGMRVITNSEKVKGVRAAVEEFLLLNHPLDCPICDKAGECTLQNYYMEHDLRSGRQEFARFKKRKALDIGPTLILDQERCVLCDRCVRFLRDWAGEEQLYIAGRGHSAYLTTFPGKKVTSPYSLNTVDLCPVGALTSKDFRFSTPTWFLERTPSVCTGCERGCAIEIDVDRRDNQIKRLRPRFNPLVNGYWMCDEGRLHYKFVNTERVARATEERSRGRVPLSMESALVRAAAVLQGASDAASPETQPAAAPLAILVSASSTLEEMYACKALSSAHSRCRVYLVQHVPEGVEDRLLRRRDRHANATGGRLLGLHVLDFTGSSASHSPAASTDIPEGSALLAVGFDYALPEPLLEFAKRFSRAVVISSRESAFASLADVLIPGLTFAEKQGLIVNFEGQVQRLSPARAGVEDEFSPWRIISGLGERISGRKAWATIEELRRDLSGAEAAFAGVDLSAIGPLGARVGRSEA